MAKTATRATAKPAAKPAGKSTAQAAHKPAQTANRAPARAAAQEKAPEPERTAAHPAPAVRKAAPPPAEVLNQLPAHMRDDVDMGKEGIGQQDMDLPRLKLIQGTSKELQLFDDLRPGHFFHTASETIFDDAFRVVPIFMDRQYILWRPLEDGGGILARTLDGQHWNPAVGEFKVKLDRKDGGDEVIWKVANTVEQSGLANWGPMNPKNNDSPPAATLMYNFLLAFPDYPDLMPAVLTFQRASIKVGRKFMTKLKTVRTPLFGSVFELSSVEDHNSANQDFKNISIVGAGVVEDPDLYQMYKDLHLSIAGKGLSIKDIDTLQGETEADDGEGGDAGKPAY
jgi:hypothetical protein